MELVYIDIDGFIDIVTSHTPTLDLKKIIWYKNDLNQSFTKYNLFVGSDYFYSPSHVKTVDINNDGLIDLVSYFCTIRNFNFLHQNEPVDNCSELADLQEPNNTLADATDATAGDIILHL